MSRFSGPPMNTASSTALSLLGPGASGRGRFAQHPAPRGGVARAGVDLDHVGRERREARGGLVRDASDADLAPIGQVARPAGADRPGVDDRRAGKAVELAVVGVADQEEERLGAVLFLAL